MKAEKELTTGKNVRRLKQSNGKLTKYWQYSFMYNGKRYGGSTACIDKRDAEKFVENLKAEMKSEFNKGSKKVDSYIQTKSIKSFTEKVTRDVKGDSIFLDKVWSIFKKEAPALMKREPSPTKWKQKESCWNDFKDFLESKEVEDLRQVSKSHAQEYVGLLKDSGKFNKRIISKKGSYTSEIKELSSSTINEYMTHIKQVFTLLHDRANLLINPFDGIPKVDGKKKKRDVFEISELTKINDFLVKGKSWKYSSNPKLDILILRTLFIIGLNTGLRRGDICMLDWSNIDLDKNRISLENSKTEVFVSIPISAPLMTFLNERHAITGGAGFVVPELADMYQNNSDGISYRFRQMLDKLKIKNTKEVTGRTVAVSNKDIHSLRHTFCYLHGIQGTSIQELQLMTGHLTPKMTEAYMMHKTEQLKEKAQKSIEEFTDFTQLELKDKKKLTRDEILKMVETMTPENLEEVKKEILKNG